MKLKKRDGISVWKILSLALVLGWMGLPTSVKADVLDEGLERPPLVLGQGEQRLVRVPGMLRYSLGSPCIHAHGLPGDSLLVKGTCPGNGDLWVSKRDGSSEHRSIRVEKITTGEVAPALERALSHLEQTEVLLAGAGVILRGEISSPRETARIRGLVEGYPKDVHDETIASEELLTSAKSRIDAWVKTTPYASQLMIERQDRQLFVRGSLERPALQAAAEKALRTLYPATVIELDSLPDTAPTVHFRVFLLELRKSRFRSLGLSWPALAEGAFRVTTSGIQDALALDVALQALEGDGSARLLSNPELVVRAPGEAELFAGGEIPIKNKSAYASSTTWKTYGLTLHLKVTNSSGDRVRLDIFTEVSHLDASIAIDDVPGIQANRMRTQVDARYGVPLLLSGLLQQGMREQAKGLPFLRSIPVLGALFGSEDYLNERSELVAILLPASAPPASPMDRIARFMPRGPSPSPRNFVSPGSERALRESPEWPWNALK